MALVDIREKWAQDKETKLNVTCKTRKYNKWVDWGNLSTGTNLVKQQKTT